MRNKTIFILQCKCYSALNDTLNKIDINFVLKLKCSKNNKNMKKL